MTAVQSRILPVKVGGHLWAHTTPVFDESKLFTLEEKSIKTGVEERALGLKLFHMMTWIQ